MFRKLAFTALACLFLGGCFHVQLTGSVGGASLAIAPLRSPGEVLASAESFGPAEWIAQMGQADWDAQSSFVQLLSVGMARPDTSDLDPGALYLVTATGGEDYDPNGRGRLSRATRAVQGSWHAIVRGQRIIEGNLKVSALTEAVYQQFREQLDDWTDEELVLRLESVARMVIADVDNSGAVDYNDVLDYHRSVDADAFLGNLNRLDALSEAVAAGQPQDDLQKAAKAAIGATRVALNFDIGTVTLRTYNWEAPITAANFLGYVGSGYYDRVLVHRAIQNFMIQMGGFGVDGTDEEGRLNIVAKQPGAPIVNESSNGLSNIRGTLAMARTSNPDSATSQFFINQVRNSFLDFGSVENPDGYAVFARVLSGMDVVDQIAAEPTTSVGGIGNDVPARGVVLESAIIE